MDQEHANNAKTTPNLVSSAALSPPSAPRTLSSVAAAVMADRADAVKMRSLPLLQLHALSPSQSSVTVTRVD